MSDSPTPDVQPTPDPTPAPAPTPEAPAVVAVAEPPAPAPEAPVAEAPPVVEAPVPAAPAAVPEAPVAAAPAPVKEPKRTVQVPVWALVAVVAVVLVAGAFFVGRSTASSSSDSGPKTLAEAVELTASGEMEVGDFDARTLLQALSQNDNLDLGTLGDLILGGNGRN